MAIASGDDSTSLLQVFAGVRHSQGQRILAAVAKEGSTICVEAAAGDVAPVAGSFIAKMSQQAVEVAAGSVAEQAGSFCVPKQDVLLMQRTFGLNTARDFEAALGAKKQTTTTTTISFENFDFAEDLDKEVMVKQCPGDRAGLLQAMDATVAHKREDSEWERTRKEREADEMRVCECRGFLKSSVGKMWNENLMNILGNKKVKATIDDATEKVNPTQLLQRNFDAALATKRTKTTTTTSTTTTTELDVHEHQSQVEGMTTACTKASELPAEVFGAYGMTGQVQLPSWAIVAKLLNDPDIAVLFKEANITEGWQHCDQSWVVHGACGEFVEGYCRGHGRDCYDARLRNLWASRSASQAKAVMKKECVNHDANEENCVEACKLHVSSGRTSEDPSAPKSEDGCAQFCDDKLDIAYNMLGQKIAKRTARSDWPLDVCAKPGAMRDACDCLGV